MKCAEALGCRLMTVEEWTAASNFEGTDHTWNLRDQSWADQRDLHQAAFDQLVKANGLTGVVKVMDPTAWSYFKIGKDLGNVSPKPDGFVFFLPAVPSNLAEATYGRFFYHINGNVWQYALDANKKVTLVGSSALSPPELKSPIQFTNEAQRERLMNKQWADVGFRLAFDGRPPTLRHSLADAVDNTRFLDAPAATPAQ
jgi:hypothetical protein